VSACSAGCGYCGRCASGAPSTVLCTDCGQTCVNGPDETGALCEECCEDRDRWAVAYQVRMAKADLKAVTPVVVDVALVPIGNVEGPIIDVALVPVVAAFAAWVARKDVA
jgi:hypothetical protein